MADNLTEEALRYLGAANAPEPLRRQVEEELVSLQSQLRPRYTYRVWDLDFRGDGIALHGAWPGP